MKQEEIERLRAICEKEGFKLKSLDHGDLFVIKPDKKVDEWEGVEFAECIDGGTIITNGRIYRILRFLFISGKCIQIIDDKYENPNLSIEFFRPSTESAYVEQLKKDAFDRFGEIKAGDWFKTDWDGAYFKIDDDGLGFNYRKAHDQLFFNGWEIYNQGKWATKIEEVKFIKCALSENNLGFDFKIENQKFDWHEAGQYLAEKLQEFINEKK